MGGFATLQEAWGVPTFQAEPVSKAAGPARQPHVPVSAALDSAAVAAAVHPPQRVPAGKSPKDTLHRYMEDVYARRGARGVATVLGRQLVDELCALRGRKSGGAQVLDMLLGDTDTLLFVLIAAFVFLVVIDAMRG
jgi:hypothetical protein